MTKDFYFVRFTGKKEFDPSEYSPFRPSLSDTAASMCSERSAIVKYYLKWGARASRNGG